MCDCRLEMPPRKGSRANITLVKLTIYLLSGQLYSCAARAFANHETMEYTARGFAAVNVRLLGNPETWSTVSAESMAVLV